MYKSVPPIPSFVGFWICETPGLKQVAVHLSYTRPSVNFC